MDSLPQDSALPPKTWADRVQAVFEVLLLSGVVSSLLASLFFYTLKGKGPLDTLGDVRVLSAFILLESAFTFVLLATVLKFHRETIFGLGLQWNRWKRHLLIGIILVPLLLTINAGVALVFRLYLPQYFIDKNPITSLIHTPQQLALLIFSALIAGGIKEELQRAFILTRFRTYLGGAGVGLLLWSIGFGMGHYVQGVQGIVIAALYGFIFGVTYLLSKSLIGPIIAHGAYDTVVLLAYWFSRPQ